MSLYILKVLWMIDTAGFTRQLSHAIDKDDNVESADVQAIKIDDANGIAASLGFGESMLSKVDYCACANGKVQLIELTDLEESLKNCRDLRIELTAQAKEQARAQKNKLTAKDHKRIRKQAWHVVTDEFKCKWNGSIAVVERLYRRNEIANDPNYQLLIVCKNKTDSIMLDELTTQLAGMMGKVRVCNTNRVSDFLIS
jgi:hypothetical protein